MPIFVWSFDLLYNACQFKLFHSTAYLRTNPSTIFVGFKQLRYMSIAQHTDLPLDTVVITWMFNAVVKFAIVQYCTVHQKKLIIRRATFNYYCLLQKTYNSYFAYILTTIHTALNYGRGSVDNWGRSVVVRLKEQVRTLFGVWQNLGHHAIHHSLYSTVVLHVSAAVNMACRICSTVHQVVKLVSLHIQGVFEATK